MECKKSRIPTGDVKMKNNPVGMDIMKYAYLEYKDKLDIEEEEILKENITDMFWMWIEDKIDNKELINLCKVS